MQNIILYLTIFFSGILLHAQNTSVETLNSANTTKYEQGMRKAFSMWKEGKQWEAADVFERIATAEPDNWLPSFYAAQINVFYSFEEKDKAKVTAQLAKALNFLNDSKAISKDNPEILVLEAQYYTAWVVQDGQQYGMKYSGKIVELYNKALQINPNNPRVVLGKAEWDMGGAKFFGQSTEPYCKDVERAIALFATFKPEGEFHPQWGLEHAQELLKTSCAK